MTDGKRMETNFQIESIPLAICVGKEELRRFSDVQSYLKMTSGSSRVTKVWDVGIGGVKSPSAGAKKTKRSRKASGSKDENKPTDGPLSGSNNIDVDSI